MMAHQNLNDFFNTNQLMDNNAINSGPPNQLMEDDQFVQKINHDLNFGQPQEIRTTVNQHFPDLSHQFQFDQFYPNNQSNMGHFSQTIPYTLENQPNVNTSSAGMPDVKSFLLSAQNSNFFLSPSIISMPGKFNFCASVSSEHNDKNKWCYSTQVDKTYVAPYQTFPISLSMSEWRDDVSLTAMAVYKKTADRAKPVTRCYNCTVRSPVQEIKDHIIQVESVHRNATYHQISGRYLVSTPLMPPPQGEHQSTLLVKSTCLTSCVGGPNRKPFVLILTLWQGGEEICRQIIDMKCCKCPGRDMGNDEKQVKIKSEQEPNIDSESLISAPNSPLSCITPAIKHELSKTKTGKVLKRIKCKVEDSNQKVALKVPNIFVADVKKFINRLVAVDIVKSQNPHLLPHSDEDI